MRTPRTAAAAAVRAVLRRFGYELRRIPDPIPAEAPAADRERHDDREKPRPRRARR